MHGEGVSQMAHSDSFGRHHDSHHVELIALSRTAVAIDPYLCRPGQFASLTPSDSRSRINKLDIASGLHFHEGHHSVPLHDQIEIPVPTPESSTNYQPTVSAKPGRRHPLAEYSQRLPRIGHAQ